MHETTELEFALEAEAERIRDAIEGSPPVVVIAGGTDGRPGATATPPPPPGWTACAN